MTSDAGGEAIYTASAAQKVEAGPIELYDMSNDDEEKRDDSKRRPDLAKHATNLLDKAHEPDPNWKVRTRKRK